MSSGIDQRAPEPAAGMLAARMAGVEASAVREILKLTQGSSVLSMAGGLPDPALFDVEGLGRAFDRVLGAADAPRHLQYSVTEGDPDLRATLAGLTRARGIDAAADDVLVTTGSQQALDLLATALLDPGDAVVVESPCYLAALQVLRLHGATVVPMRTDEDGLDPDAVRAAVRAHGAKLVYTVPTFQNPTGASLPADRRERLVAVAREEGVLILEDDPYGELRYSGTAPTPLAGSGADRVVYVSSLSKIVAPGLRIGWLVAPAAIRAAVVAVKQARDLHTSTVDQRAAYEYLASGALPAHLRHVREVYGRRLATLLAGLGAAMPPGSTWTRPHGGMFVWLTLPEGVDTHARLASAVAEGVAYVPGAAFFHDGRSTSSARLSFVTLEPAQIDEGVRRLARVLGAAPPVTPPRAPAAP